MADNLPRDDDFVPVAGAVSTVDDETVMPVQINPTTGGVVVEVAE
jgi:hypothetical protein